MPDTHQNLAAGRSPDPAHKRPRCPRCGKPWVFQDGEWSFACGSYFDGCDAGHPFVLGDLCEEREAVGYRG